MSENKTNGLETKNKEKYRVMYVYSFLMIIAGFLLGSPGQILDGITTIVLSPSMLITDYFELGGLGPALVNAGILMVFSVFLGQISKAKMNGGLIAAIFTVGGFALFGKNIYNVHSIILGVYLYSLIKKEDFSKHITVALFGTALAPVVSQVTFGMGFSPVPGLALGTLAGVTIGLMLPPLAGSFSNFHQGFNLYNIGFTAGITGMLFMSVFRMTGYNHEIASIIYKETSIPLVILLMVYFASMIIYGFASSKGSDQTYVDLIKHPIKSATDFVHLKGFSHTLVNMGVLGILSTGLVLFFKAPLNGPLLGGVFTIVGFAAFGKHPTNLLPIMAGVILAYGLTGADFSATGTILTVLFATTLAPIAGHFGPLAGILAGFLHMALVSNLGYLHGGMDLYNNGFSGGFIAAILVPVLKAYIGDKKVHS